MDQHKTIRDELAKMRSNVETASRKQNESHQQEILTLKKNFSKLEKFTQKQHQEYEKKIYHIIKVFLRMALMQLLLLRRWTKNRFLVQLPYFYIITDF